MRLSAIAFLLFALEVQAQALVPYRVEGIGIPEPLAAAGDAARGRQMLAAREPANCILCHGAPAPLREAGVRFSGDLAPPLDGAGARWTAAQLRLRLVDSSRLNPQTIMPAYYRTEGLTEVAAAFRGRPILTAAEIEDLVAYLVTLK
jgi:sulfur-oxidizing protein SoxX